MKAVILAGGLGARLRPFTEVIPKPLLPVGERSLLEIQVERLKQNGVDEVYLATNYKSDYLRHFLGDGSRYGVKLHVSEETKPLGTCGPITLLKDHLTEPFFMLNGDILTTLDFRTAYRFALGLDADLTVVTKEINVPFHFGKVVTEGDLIVDVTEKVDQRHEILAGIYVCKPPLLALIPDDTYYGIDTLIKDMLRRKMNVGRYLMKEYWLDIGRVEDYQAAQGAYEREFTDREPPT